MYQAACISASGLCFQSGNITSAFIISDALLRILFIFCTHSIAFDTLSCSFTPSLFAIIMNILELRAEHCRMRISSYTAPYTFNVFSIV